uniref:Striatin domain-containing protein n=1 Tax=Syphacia muris TaxID=451379 RepID=A0A0N5AD45_9BILA
MSFQRASSVLFDIYRQKRKLDVWNILAMRDLLKEEAQLIEELRFKVEVVKRESSDDLRSSGIQEHYEVKGKSGPRVGKSNPSNKVRVKI